VEWPPPAPGLPPARNSTRSRRADPDRITITNQDVPLLELIEFVAKYFECSVGEKQGVLYLVHGLGTFQPFETRVYLLDPRLRDLTPSAEAFLERKRGGIL